MIFNRSSSEPVGAPMVDSSFTFIPKGDFLEKVTKWKEYGISVSASLAFALALFFVFFTFVENTDNDHYGNESSVKAC